MADKYINEVGVGIIRDWANGKFALDTDLDALDAKVDEIIAEGGEPNVIETVKVDGIPLIPDAQKAVDIDLQSELAGFAFFETNANETSLVSNGGNSITFINNLDNTVSLTSSEMSPAPSPLATTDYVDENGGKIQKIKYGGTELTIDTSDKSVNVPKEIFIATKNSTTYANLSAAINAEKHILLDEGNASASKALLSIGTRWVSGDKVTLRAHKRNKFVEWTIDTNNVWTESDVVEMALATDVPTAVSQLTNDSNYQNDTQVDAKIASAVASAVTLKGSVATYSALPSTGQKHGDMYDVLDTGKNYVWIVEEGTGRWDDYAGTMDMSAYWTSTSGQANTLEAMTVAEVNAILNPSA